MSKVSSFGSDLVLVGVQPFFTAVKGRVLSTGVAISSLLQSSCIPMYFGQIYTEFYMLYEHSHLNEWVND